MKKKNLRILLSSALIAALTGCIDINDDNDEQHGHSKVYILRGERLMDNQ